MCRSVRYSAVAFNVFEMTRFLDVLRTLKHHVLEQMGEAGATLDFVA
jgi:hypothetical protein